MSVVGEQLSIGLRWLREERRVVCALLIDAEGSSPFQPGAFMLIDADGAIEGSITGGCVESDVVASALDLLAGDGAPRTLIYGVSDEAAHEVGLMCGGTVHVFVHELSGDGRAVCAEVFDFAARGLPAGIATLLEGELAGAKLGVVGGPRDRKPARARAARPERGARPCRAQRARHECAAPLRALRRGAGERARASTSRHSACRRRSCWSARSTTRPRSRRWLRPAGYEVVIVDAREAFARAERFSRVATVHVGWPGPAIEERELGPRDGVIVFSHDPKFDEPAILAALRSGAGYIGALGSRRTARDRRERLIAAGADPDALARVHSPCGLDIGAATPEEVAISIMAEVIAARSGRAGEPLIATESSIRPR